MTLPMHHISVAIDVDPATVYEFAANPENLPSWAAGLADATIRREGDHWITASPMGTVRIAFAPKNSYFVLDHDVTVPSGETTHNAMRVLPNGDGCEVVFSLIRPPSMTDDEFEKDAAQIRKDLETLKATLTGARRKGGAPS